LLELWELAHDWRLCAAGVPDLTARSVFPQETLNLLGCGRGLVAPRAGAQKMTARLLVVDDEPRTAELTAELLRRAGYVVEVAGSGSEALQSVRSSSPDLMLLDYEMPDMEAPEVLDSLRSGADRIAFPVIILTGARHASGDQVLGIDHGATDYIVKGTDRQVLLARIRGALRQSAPEARVVVAGRLRIDMARGQASLDDRDVKLERRPLLMLQLLAGRPGEVVGRAELLERVWGTKYAGFEHSLEQAVHQIRRALNEPGWIETVRGIGYRFVAQP
jgi:DNA-binding response OmpR family regulator